jgi:hypothetical protein
MRVIKRFFAWILSGEAVTVEEMQKRLVLYNELI